MTKRYALYYPDYDGKGTPHYDGCKFKWGEGDVDLNAMRTFRTEANAKATNDYKYYHAQIVPVNVKVEPIIE